MNKIMRIKYITVVTILLLNSVMPLHAQNTRSDYDLSPGKKIIIKDSTFKRGSDVLEDKSRFEVEKLLLFLQKRQQLEIEVAGHADNSGNEQQNIALSLARAETVKVFLVQRGIAPLRLHTKGYGSQFPIASNKTPEGQSQNRRVEITALSPITRRLLTSVAGDPLEPEGVITVVQRQVNTLAPWNIDWYQAELRQPIYEQFRLNTLPKARSEITFKDMSKLHIGENAHIVVYGSEPSAKTRSGKENVALLQGALLVKLKELRQQEPFEIKTENARINLPQSTSKINIDAERRSVISVFEGGANVQWVEGDQTKSQPVHVPPNYGLRVNTVTGAEKVLPLPETPEFIEAIPEILPTSAEDSSVNIQTKITWKPLPHLIRVEIFESESMQHLIVGVVVKEQFAKIAIPKGQYFLQLTSIDKNGLESVSSGDTFETGIISKPTKKFRFRYAEYLLLVCSFGFFWAGLLIREKKFLLASGGILLLSLILFIV